MKQQHLKVLRIIISLIFLITTTLLFVDFRGIFPASWINTVLFLQFVPSVIKFLNIVSIAAIGFIIIVLVTLLFGRVYCSTICPLGILQDVISFFSRKFKKKSRYKFSTPKNLWRYGFLAAALIFLVFGGIFLVYLLDPYSNFGRMASDLFRPLVIGINNIFAKGLEKLNVFFLYPVDYHGFNIKTIWFPVFMFGLVLWLSITRGRLFCNTICPVGTLLGLLSRVSLFRIKMDSVTCTKCGECAVVCKSECINIKNLEVDFSRCVGCFNCLQSCPSMSINYETVAKSKKSAVIKNATDVTKRDFMAKTLIYSIGLLGISNRTFGKNQKDTVLHEQNIKSTIPIKKENPVSPPGSKSLEHFKDYCTACHLCVSACPTTVLQPSFLEYGFTGMLQPHMDYNTNYCNYECTICSDVCPTGAILPVTSEDKKKIQIGRVDFIIENCIVYLENTACGSCAEHCPTQAVRMVDYKDDLTIPEIHSCICVGCGACEYACPAKPIKAIYVDGSAEHGEADEPHFDELKETVQEEFPF
ncbi:MAG: 4Fe-4S binding protein [Bacteroidales bacterium]|nr:4Fe-4S binding protein [Bacteroidales bacterium]